MRTTLYTSTSNSATLPMSMPAAHVSPSGANATARNRPICQSYWRSGSQVTLPYMVTVVASSLPSVEIAAAVYSSPEG
ncbi:MAG: hypothetical protein ABGY75_14710 [Gemmataceae bacterium]